MSEPNGWTGRDPRLRLLRSLSVMVILVLLSATVLDGQPNDATTLGLLVGALLVMLGFEAGVRLPGTGGKQ